jgi:hypothetical protein
VTPLSLTVPVTIRAAEGNNPVRRFEMVAYTGEPMRIDGFDLPVVIDCASLDTTQQTIPALFNHTADLPVGQIQAVSVTNGRPPIRASGVFTPSGAANDRAAEVINRADAGYRWQVSIGGNPAAVERYQRGERFTANGRTYEGPAVLARGVRLREISFVTIGGDSLTSAVVAASKPIIKGASMSFEEWLTSMGFDSEAQGMMTEVQMANMKKMYGDETGDDAEDVEDVDAEPLPAIASEDGMTEEEKPMMTAEDGMVEDEEDKPPANAGAKRPTIQAAAVKAEKKRILSIQAAAKKYGDPTMTINGTSVRVAAHAIQAGWTPEQAEVQAMRSQLRTPPSNVIRAGGHAEMQALQGAMILQAGGKLDHPAYQTSAAVHLLPQWLRAGINDAQRNRYMEQAHKLSKLNAIDFCRHSLRASGRAVPSDQDDMIQAAFSSGSLVNSMTTSMNAKLLTAYLETPDTTNGWVLEDDVPNYLQNERVRTIRGASLSEQPENAEADHDSFEDVQEVYKVKRYTRQIEVDEIAVVNDTLGAIARKPIEFGQAAARLRPDLVYGTLLANPTLNATGRALFNATDANLITSNALTQPNMTRAIARMSTIQENGVNIDVTPTHLIVPPSLRDPARVIIGSQINLASTTVNVPIGAVNPLYDYNLDLRPEKRLENGVTHPATRVTYGGSATTWYLASSFAPALEVGYLRGHGRAPKVRSWVNDKQGRFGMGWDVQMVVGVCVLDWKGIQQSNA